MPFALEDEEKMSVPRLEDELDKVNFALNCSSLK